MVRFVGGYRGALRDLMRPLPGWINRLPLTATSVNRINTLQRWWQPVIYCCAAAAVIPLLSFW